MSDLSILQKHGWAYIPDLRKAGVPGPFRGRPILTTPPNAQEAETLAAMCPTGAIEAAPFRLDIGKCTFCGECAFQCPSAIRFTPDYRMATNDPARLVVEPGADRPIELDPSQVRSQIRKMFRKSLKLRQVSAAGDNACELELNATLNPNFDFGRYGIDFVASPRHADGVVITGPISENMAAALDYAHNAVPNPKIVVLAGTDAISGGLFANSPALDRHFLAQHRIDLYVPGNPVHPLTFIHGIMDLLGIQLDAPRAEADSPTHRPPKPGAAKR